MKIRQTHFRNTAIAPGCNAALPEDIAREIERLVAEAKRGNRTLHAGNEARRLAALYPDIAIAHDDLCDKILALAIAARAPTQLNSVF